MVLAGKFRCGTSAIMIVFNVFDVLENNRTTAGMPHSGKEVQAIVVVARSP